MKRFVFIAALLCATSPTLAGENCTCRYQGTDIEEGKTACLTTPNGPQMARCERVLNNTSWKFLGNSCPYAGMKEQKIQSLADPEIYSITKSGKHKRSIAGELKT